MSPKTRCTCATNIRCSVSSVLHTESEINNRRNVFALVSYDCVLNVTGEGFLQQVEGPKFLGIVTSKLTLPQG
jgi:hypothetical protein